MCVYLVHTKTIIVLILILINNTDEDTTKLKEIQVAIWTCEDEIDLESLCLYTYSIVHKHDEKN